MTENTTDNIPVREDVPTTAEVSVNTDVKPAETTEPEVAAPRFIPYNSGMPRLVTSEYGRNIQNLIEYCLTIEDRGERTDCAYAIADVMATLFPAEVGEGNDMKAIWDQMQIISGFRLDVDFPYEPLTEAAVNPKPVRLPYQNKNIRFRHYGSSIEKMVEEVCKMENSEEKDDLVFMLACQMKKMLTILNKENATDARVLQDLALFSKGHIRLDPATYPLPEIPEEIPATPAPKKKKKKR
ncbi:MAG: DUF4290 domain-containing protein [Muribaculaceae bacterium]|nr:DUF4290 domain-containing protein [Muribaculaceae bacterium]